MARGYSRLKEIIVLDRGAGVDMRNCIVHSLFLVLALCSLVLADPPYPELRNERDYQIHINKLLQGKVEYVLPDRTRVDILTDDLVIEIDFADKWYEAIGQASWYSFSTGKKPVIYLIVEHGTHEKYVTKAVRLCRAIKVHNYHITVIAFRNY